jgi:hypothetical protein
VQVPAWHTDAPPHVTAVLHADPGGTKQRGQIIIRLSYLSLKSRIDHSGLKFQPSKCTCPKIQSCYINKNLLTFEHDDPPVHSLFVVQFPVGGDRPKSLSKKQH